MEPSRHLELLRIEGDLLAATPADALDAPVPTLPDWDVERVIRHTGKVHRWVSAALAAGPDGEIPALEALPKGPACLDAYAEALDDVVTRLSNTDPDETAWTFRGPAGARFWMRRQAHEVAVHRIDAADAVAAAGGSAPVPMLVDGAADAVDEWITLFLEHLWTADNPPPAELHGSIHLHGTDDPAPDDGAEWLVTIDGDGVRHERVHAKGDVALRGSAQDLLLTLWRRRPLDTLEVIGDADLAARLVDAVRI